MRNVQVKFCGLRFEQEIEAVNQIRPEYIGFVFYPPSSRNISFDQAGKLREKLRKEIQAVGVFVDEEVSAIAALAEKGVIDLIQLHGHEDSRYIQRLKAVCSLPIIQAFRISHPQDLETARNSEADRILLDAPSPGSGALFDWSLIPDDFSDYILAGGLSVDNAGLAAAKTRAAILDVSSGIESDGRKDEQKMRAFMKAIERMAA